MNARHAIAVSLALGKAGLDQFCDAAVSDRSLHGRPFTLEFRDDASLGVEAATVEVTLIDGSVHSFHVPVARGSLHSPLTDTELEHKLRDLCDWGQSGVNAEALIAALWSIDQCSDAGALMHLATPPVTPAFPFNQLRSKR